jgi:sterol desaturase/sphingolipid hydroxylase (fatty acid hydroxylase superfamily)
MHSKVDFATGLCLMALSVGGYLVATQFPPAPKGLAPGDFPKALFALLFLLGGILAANAFYAMKKRMAPDKTSYEVGELKRIFVLAAVIGAYIQLLSVFGYLLLTPIVVFVMMYLYGLRKWAQMAAISIATSITTYVLFNNYLYVLLPRFNLF